MTPPKQLTLEHICPYLPYGLTGLWKNGKNKIYKVTNICVCSDGNISLGHPLKTRYKHEINRPLNEFKPLLLPLEALKDYPDDEWVDIKKIVKQNDCINDIPYWAMQILIENHFDINSLLKSGFAIDKRTVKV